jgi:protein-tyrosine phosphatase
LEEKDRSATVTTTVPWELNLSWVTRELAVGGRFPMAAAAHLATGLGIRRVVDVRVEEVDDEVVLRTHGIELLHLPTLDTRAVSIPMLHEGVRWIRAQLADGHKVYVHCEHGIGRSALVACCALVGQGLAPLEALEVAKRDRPQISPSPEQLQAFIDWAAEWSAMAPVPWRPPTLEQLTRIAYRHLRTTGAGPTGG